MEFKFILNLFSTLFSIIPTKISHSVFSGLSLNHTKLCLHFQRLYRLNKSYSELLQWIHYIFSKPRFSNATFCFKFLEFCCFLKGPELRESWNNCVIMLENFGLWFLYISFLYELQDNCLFFWFRKILTTCLCDLVFLYYEFDFSKVFALWNLMLKVSPNACNLVLKSTECKHPCA